MTKVFEKNLWFILLPAGLLITAIFIWTGSPNPHLTNKSEKTLEASNPPPPVLLSDESAERGINFMHSQLSKKITGLDESLGSGACAFDMDNDNDMDLYLVGGSGQQRYYGKKSWWANAHTGHLYRNKGNGFFEDVTEQSGLDFSIWGMGCNVADFNLDGYDDLLITGRKQNMLFKNLGNGHFRQTDWGKSSRWSTSASIGDYNNDGYMDIYIGNYLRYDNSANHFEGLSGYDTSITQFNPRNYPAESNQLFSNQGDFEFNERADELMVANADGRTLASIWFDANDDLLPDLLVLNDSGSSSQLYLNRNVNIFEKFPENKQLELSSGIRDSSLQDYDGDGDADLVLSTQQGNSVALLNNQQGMYKNLVWQSHQDSELFSGFSGFGIVFADLNNDGNMDIYHGQGLIKPDPDSPAISTGQPDAISLGDGFGHFILAPAPQTQALPWHLPLSTRSVISVDVDNDGDKDILLTSNNNPARLLINKAPITHWTGFDIIDNYGNHGNFQKLVVRTNQRQRVFFPDNNTFLGHNDNRISLVLNTGELIDSVEAYWRNGEKMTIPVSGNKNYHVIRQNQTEIPTYTTTQLSAISQLPGKLAIWQIKANKFNPQQILFTFKRVSVNLQQEMIKTIALLDAKQKLLPVLKKALSSDESKIVISAIEAFKLLELEQSYYWLAELFTHNSPDVLCSLSNAFRHFFIEEEALIQRKNLAIPHLIRLLEHSVPTVKVCAILALAESKSVRAVVPVEKILLSSDHQEVLKAAIYALGELRHTSSIDAILSLATNQPQTLKIQIKALQQLNVTKIAKNDYSAHPEVSTTLPTLPPCPLLTPRTLLTYKPETWNTLFNKCSLLQQRQWFEKHRDTVIKYHIKFLRNNRFGSETFIVILDQLNHNMNSGITKTLLTQLQQRDSLTDKISLVKALQHRLPDPAIEKILKLLLSNRQAAKALRIAAGDALIEFHPDYVMNLANELFDEHIPTK